MRPLQHLTDEELRAQLRSAPEEKQEPRLTGTAAVYAWATRFAVFPGRATSLEASELHRHFQQAGYEFGPTKQGLFYEFGRALNQLGLAKGRKQINGRDTRPRLMTRAAADYFQEWAKQYPRPEDAETFRVARGADEEGQGTP